MASGAAHGRVTPATPQWGAVEADNPIREYTTNVPTGVGPVAGAHRAAHRAADRVTELLDPGAR